MPKEDVVGTVTRIVEAMSTDQLRRALLAVPHVTAGTRGAGPIAAHLARSDAPLTRRRLAGALTNVSVRRLTVQQLDLASLQLLSVVLLLGGQLSDADLRSETDPLREDERAAIVQGLVDRVLVQRTDDGLALVDGLDGILGRHGRSVRSLILDQAVTKDDIGSMLLAHGIGRVPANKQDRLDALAALVGDHDHVHRLRDTLPDGSREMFDEIVGGGAAGVPTTQVGVDPWYFQVYNHLPVRRLPPTMDALTLLDHLGLVWVDPMTARIGVWIEVVRAVSGRLFSSWTLPLAPPLRPVHTTEGELPAMFSTLHGLLDRVAAEPLTGLKNGGVGVRAIRDLAKRLGRTAQEVELLFNLLAGAGAIREHEEAVGKGRNTSWVFRYAVDPAQVKTMRSTGTAELWRTMVDAWMAGFDVEDRYHHVAVRFQTLHDLLALDEGLGVPADQFDPWLTTRHWMSSTVSRSALLTELRVLGLVPADGPVGLTPLARLLLTAPDRLAELIPATVASFVVQADHTVVAPPTLDPEMRSGLERLAVVQSSGSATVYRLEPVKISSQLAEGHTAVSILEFLATASTVPVPPTVTRLVQDLERQRGGLTVRKATTIVTADDVMGLAAAVNVKAARLTLLAPTVAVSELMPEKVIAALRSKGLAPTVENGRIAVAAPWPGPSADAARATSSAEQAPRTRQRPLLLDPASLTAVVEEIAGLDAPRPRTTGRSARTTTKRPVG